MSTSEYGGIVEYDPNDLAANEPVDTVLVRRVINNANHHADQAGQVVCNWMVTTQGDPLEPVTPGDWTGVRRDPDAWFRFPICPTWDAKVRSDGSGYRLRVRLSGAFMTGEQADFAVVVGPYGTGRSDVYGTGTATKIISGVTGASPQPLAFDDGTGWIDVPPSVIAAAERVGALQRTRYDIGGAETTVTTARMVIMVCARPGSRVDETKPTLHGLYVAEYIGP